MPSDFHHSFDRLFRAKKWDKKENKKIDIFLVIFFYYIFCRVKHLVYIYVKFKKEKR